MQTSTRERATRFGARLVLHLIAWALLATSAAALLCGCGGGGDDDDGPDATIQPVHCAASAPVCQ